MSATIVFDLDGTLIDSLADLSQAVNRMLADTGVAPLPQETIKRFVGNGLPKLVERTMRHCDLPQDRHAELTKMTLDHYKAAASENTTVYPGVHEALAELRDAGCAMGICTNKPEAPARQILEVLNLSEFFDVVLGGDTLNTRKPDPAHLQASFDALPNTGPRFFVGDSEVDAETAQRAGVPFLLFTEGFRKSPVEELLHHASYAHSSELPGIVRDTLKNSL